MLCAFILTLSSCVDKEFDFSKIDDSDITIGDSYSIPVGNVGVDLADVFDAIESEDGSQEFVVPDSFASDVNIGAGFDQSIIDDILNTDAMTMDVVIANPLEDVEMNLTLSFIDEDGNEIVIVDNEYVGTDATTLTIDITEELLNQIANSGTINYSFDVLSGAGETVDLSNLSNLDINLILNGEGGISLF